MAEAAARRTAQQAEQRSARMDDGFFKGFGKSDR